jgi:hypothetical protein
MSIILPYSQSVVETFYRPAIVKPQNLMPVKVITDITDAANVMTREWVLCRFKGSNETRWMSKYNSEIIKFDHDVIRRLPVPDGHKEIDITVRLMQAAPGSAVIWGLPYDYQHRS